MTEVTLKKIIKDLKSVPLYKRNELCFLLITGNFTRKLNLELWLTLKVVSFFLSKEKVEELINPFSEELIETIITKLEEEIFSARCLEDLIEAMLQIGWIPE